MGKFKMFHGKEPASPVSKSVETVVKWEGTPGQHYATRDEVQKAMLEVMEQHKATFEALAKYDTQIVEKQEIVQIPVKSDTWARKHSIESRKQAQKDIDKANHLSSLLAKDCHDRIQRSENRILELESRKPEEKQVVKEITIMKSEIPKSIWIGMGILLILNILTIMIK